jgi:hypothetical protein
VGRRHRPVDRATGVVLFDEAVQVLAATALPWAGVPVTAEELPHRARQLAAVLDGPPQDLGYDITRVPTLPRSRLVLTARHS